MAEGKRIYTIQINGLQESYDGVKTLRESLDTLNDTVVKVNQEEQKTVAVKKETAAGTDALAKATQKLNEWDRSYQAELALVNAELSANKKEIKDAIKLQEAQATVDAKQLDTYRDKQTYLSALNTLIRNHSTATEEDRAAIDRMVQESAELQAELKATDEQMKIYVRNVGNYPGAAEMVVDSHKSLKSELKDLKATMSEMLASGVSKTDEAYLKLAERAGQLKDAMKDANEDIANFASDTRGMTNAINLASSAVNVYQLYNSALQVFGGENEEAAKSIQKMMGVMTLLNSLQQVQNSLLENGSATARLYTKAVELIQAALGIKKTATEADIAATKASTLAHSDMRKELVDLKAKMVDMVNNGISTSDEAYQQLADRAGQLQDALKNASSATEQNTVANKANAASAESSTVAETANTGVTTANTTAKDANTVATNRMSIAQKAGAVASNILSVALRAIPLVAIIGLVMALIQNWESIWNWFKKTFPVLDKLSNKIKNFGGFLNSLITAVKATAYAIRDYLISAISSFGTALSKLFSGDFSGAADALKNVFKDAGKAASNAFNSELSKGFARGEEERTAKAAEESNKRTKQELEELKIRERNNKTYSKKYIELQKKDFEERKKMAKGNQEELNKIKLEEMRFDAEVEDKKTAYAKEQSKKRTDAAKKAAAEAKKAAEELKKEYEELLKKVDKDIEDADKLEETTELKVLKQRDDAHKKQIEQFAKYARMYMDEWGKMDSLSQKASQRIKETEKIILETTETATEDEIRLLQGYMKELEDDFNYFNDRIEKDINGLGSAIGKVDYFLAERHEYAIDHIARSARTIRDEYKKQYDALTTDIVNMQAMTAKLSGDELDKMKKKIADAQFELKELVQKSKVELGQYNVEGLDIHIPVDVDFKNIEKRYKELRDKLKEENKEVGFSLTQIVDASIGVRSALKEIYDKATELNKTQPGTLVETFEQLAEVLGMAKGETEDEIDVYNQFVDLVKSDKPFKEIEEDLNNLVNMGSIDIAKFGSYITESYEAIKNVNKETEKVIEDSFKTLVSQQEKVISYNDKVIKRFQDATKDIKFEPVMENDALSKYIEGQILNMDKTKKRYDDLKEAYLGYQSVLKEGSKERMEYEQAWQTKLRATYQQVQNIGKIYGENSEEYKQAERDYELLTDEKKKADQAYKLEYEKVTQQIEEIDRKSARIREDYFKSLHDRMSEIYSAFNDNVFQPIANGFSDLLAFQLEEAQEALEKVTKLYDKAVEARQESADRMKEINDELRNDDGQNKEALQQRLAEEEVLLVQREETERALQKEKEKREKEVARKEAQQRVLELSQKLAEGIANTALGATAALKYGFPLGPIFAGIITAFGALQTAIIAKQIAKAKSKMETGGKIGENGISRSHRQGGHRIEGTNIEVEGQEWVINKKSSQKYDSLLRAINEDNMPLVRKQIEIIRERQIVNNNLVTKFASGGRINTLTATNAVRENSQIAEISNLIRQIDFEPVVSVRDINRTNKNLVRVQQYAGKTA